jgi:hypothetical protein
MGVATESMSLPDLQYRNNDPSENVQVEFTDLASRRRVLSFVATRPHWCEQPQIYGDLFGVPLETVFEGDVNPVPLGSAEEEDLISSFREFVNAAISGEERDFLRLMLLGKAHRSDKTYDEIRARHLVWFLDVLERRRERHKRGQE